MKRIIAAAIFLSIFMILSQVGNAASITVRAGKSVLISQLVGWDGRCRSTGYARVVITKRPRRGRVSVRRGGRFPIPKATSVGRAGKCRGRKIRGVGIYYKSPRRFRGRVRLSFRAKAANGNRYFSKRVTINVR